MKKMLSIIIPCYNMEQYIERCYTSLYIQKDASDVEFIFINDGSTDNTLNILRDLERKDSRVIIIDQDNAGVSVARNKGLSIANGDYIYLLDPDDYLSTEDVLKDIMLVIKKNNPDMIIPANNRETEECIKYKPLPFLDGMYNKYELFNSCAEFPTQPQIFYRASIIKDNKIAFESNAKCGEVYAFTISFFKYANKCYVLNKPCQNYYWRTDGATKKNNYNRDLTVLYALKMIDENKGDLFEYASFRLTALKIVLSFTYNKYLKIPTDKKMTDSINELFSDDLLKKYMKSLLFKRGIALFDRCFVIYLYTMPKMFGFKLLKLLVKKLK